MTQPGPDASEIDRALVRRFLDTRAARDFLALYRRHTPRLYGTALRVAGGERSDADDLVQETWIRATERLAQFEWRSALLSWLTSILLNCWREWLRRQGRELQLSDLPDPAIDHASDSDAIDLERALARLPEGYRAVVVLHDVNGHTHQEIGDMLGIAAGTSKSTLSRARVLLRRGRDETSTREREREIP